MIELNNPFIEVANKRVLMRLDLNLPMKNGDIQSEHRLNAMDGMLTQELRKLSVRGARVMLMSHLGRPPEGQITPEQSLKPIAELLGMRLVPPATKVDAGHPPSEIPFSSLGGLKLVKNYLEHPPEVKPGEIVLLENVRFNRGETANDPELARKYASLCDVFVMNAFGAAHRAHASTHGVIQYAPIACAGSLLKIECGWIDNFVKSPPHPLVAILGGAKVSSKLPVLEALTDYVDVLLPGGGIANTFLMAKAEKEGKKLDLGDSLCEPELVPVAKRLLDKPNCKIVLPEDVRVSGPGVEDGKVRDVNAIGAEECVMDLGPRTLDNYIAHLENVRTILWNGPLGVFEQPAFAEGTKALARAVAESSATSLAGGGETIAAIEQFGVQWKINHTSTGGGAFLAALARESLPSVEAIEARHEEFVEKFVPPPPDFP